MERYKAKFNRNQMSLSPMCFDDMINENNPVKAIDAIVESMEIPTFHKLTMCRFMIGLKC